MEADGDSGRPCHDADCYGVGVTPREERHAPAGEDEAEQDDAEGLQQADEDTVQRAAEHDARVALAIVLIAPVEPSAEVGDLPTDPRPDAHAPSVRRLQGRRIDPGEGCAPAPALPWEGVGLRAAPSWRRWRARRRGRPR